jgi:hypothetical protein
MSKKLDGLSEKDDQDIVDFCHHPWGRDHGAGWPPAYGQRRLEPRGLGHVVERVPQAAHMTERQLTPEQLELVEERLPTSSSMNAIPSPRSWT